MNLLEKIEYLEDSIESMELEIIKKKRVLRELLNGANSHCLKLVSINDRVTDSKNVASKFLNVLHDRMYEDVNVKVDVDTNSIYVKMNDFVSSNFGNLKAKSVISNLKSIGIVNGEHKEYYISTRINGKSVKCIKMDLNRVMYFVEEQ
ncbi:hypothetical protein [Clostridium sp.]|uniref:hypothetical protein n=1 Tax=Clostridium sp. TaxID=1506 RepID=UPI003F2A5262